MIRDIDYLKVSHAVLSYRTMGFNYLEVPWIARWDNVQATMPEGVGRFRVSLDQDGYQGDLGCLIGSAEQGLLDIRDSLTADTRYVAASPCFRHEPVETEGYRQREFFKVELMIARPTNPETALKQLILSAKILMKTWAKIVAEVKTEDGFDLCVNGVEVGSYGIREFRGFQWCYGTGLALPRFDYALGVKNGTP